MLVAEWSAGGDRELRVKRIGDVNIFYVSSCCGAWAENICAAQLIFNPSKTYRIELKEDAFELHEDTPATGGTHGS